MSFSFPVGEVADFRRAVISLSRVASGPGPHRPLQQKWTASALASTPLPRLSGGLSLLDVLLLVCKCGNNLYLTGQVPFYKSLFLTWQFVTHFLFIPTFLE